MTTTTDLLSHQNWICFPEKWGNQRAHTTTMGKSSCHSMITPWSLLSCIWGGHLPWNHFPLKYPPKPIAPEALVYRLMPRDRVTVESRKIEHPFHPARKGFPHIKVLEKFLVQTDVMEMVGYAPGKVNHMLQESRPRDDCFAGELQGTDKWLELNQTHWTATLKRI